MSFIESSESELINKVDSYNVQNTIPKSYVHRTMVGEVFLTDIKKIHDNKYVTVGYLPKSHSYFNDLFYQKTNDRVYDAILLLEVCRQTSIYVTHHFFSVPYSAKFVFDNADFTLFDSEIPYKTECSTILVVVDIIERKFRRSELNGLVFHMDIYVDGYCYAQKIMSISWMDDRKWYRLRSQRPLECYDTTSVVPATSFEVGRQLLQNVVVGNLDIHNSGVNTTLIVDQCHPSIFDHPLDHVPGMLLIEAYRQTALLAILNRLGAQHFDLVIKRYNVNFKTFCEFNLPIYCHANIGNLYFKKGKKNIIVSMVISQNKQIVSESELTITFK
ncbi:AfsA-related hotdog domain-containing protein [Serratia microhaemolytica]|uniref:AfsA-related hotdog domain-containing protein n=1 Tax=Serratia microhaemolytica TaxID=2675110 RepID=UPI000FDE1DB5|nr:AfsA-related hotdog domain-containing protein [Serratia microhaemolytica]